MVQTKFLWNHGNISTRDKTSTNRFKSIVGAALYNLNGERNVFEEKDGKCLGENSKCSRKSVWVEDNVCINWSTMGLERE